MSKALADLYYFLPDNNNLKYVLKNKRSNSKSLVFSPDQALGNW